MDTAKTIVAAVLGLIAGLLVFPYFDAYVLALIAFLGAVAVGFLVFGAVRALLANVGTHTSRW